MKEATSEAHAQKSPSRGLMLTKAKTVIGTLYFGVMRQRLMFLTLIGSKRYGVARVRSTMKNAVVVGELHFIDGIMHSQMYCEILKEKKLPLLCVP